MPGNFLYGLCLLSGTFNEFSRYTRYFHIKYSENITENIQALLSFTKITLVLVYDIVIYRSIICRYVYMYPIFFLLLNLRLKIPSCIIPPRFPDCRYSFQSALYKKLRINHRLCRRIQSATKQKSIRRDYSTFFLYSQAIIQTIQTFFKKQQLPPPDLNGVGVRVRQGHVTARIIR